MIRHRWWQRRAIKHWFFRLAIAVGFAVIGAFVGGFLGIPVAIAYVELVDSSNFEGASGFALIAISNAGSLLFAIVFGLYGLFVWTTESSKSHGC
jgi:hypothetical protein